MSRFLLASCWVVISRDLYNPMQLVVPSAVRMADMIDANICSVHFKVSFLFIIV